MAPELVGTSADGVAVSGESQNGEGVRGVSLAGLDGAGVAGKGSPEGSPAGRFDGDVNVDGTVNVRDVIAQGNVSAIGNVNAGQTVNGIHVSAQGNVSAVGNLNGGNVNVEDTVNTTHLIAQGNISALGNVNAVNLNLGRSDAGTGDVILIPREGHIVAQGNISALGNVNVGKSINSVQIRADGNISALGNVNAGIDVNAGGTVNTTHVIAQGNISALGNVNAANINVTGDITLASGDCAEEFEVDTMSARHVAPGTVVVFGQDGCLRQSSFAYDACAAGVVAGGGDYRPAIILNKRESNAGRAAVALIGRVLCNVDATYGPIEVGDLLTTSNTPGHAMKAADPSQAVGAVIGKALRPLREGKALVPILVFLR